jgi:hypothetical protein
MTGMQITVTIDGADFSVDWLADTNGVGGSATTDNWTLAFTGSDTWDAYSYWVLTTESTISQLVINAATGGILFDIFDTYKVPYDPVTGLLTPTGNPDTPGSNRGWWQDIGSNGPSSNDLTVTSDSVTGTGTGYTWTFSDPVSLYDSDPVGDLFGILTIKFDENFWSTTNTFSFQADTDMVPEPSTLLLVAFGLLGAAGIGRKKND